MKYFTTTLFIVLNFLTFCQDTLKLDVSYLRIDSELNFQDINSMKTSELIYDPFHIEKRNNIHLIQSNPILDSSFFSDKLKICKNTNGVIQSVCKRRLMEGVWSLDSLVIMENNSYHRYTVHSKDSIEFKEKLQLSKDSFSMFSPVQIQDFSKTSDSNGYTVYFDEANYSRITHLFKGGYPISSSFIVVKNGEEIANYSEFFSFFNLLNIKLIFKEEISGLADRVQVIFVENKNLIPYTKFLQASLIHDFFIDIYSIYYPVILSNFPELLDKIY